ncbi:Jasmonic acid-amido synthetase JAR1 [Glycine soja]|uniref:Jasmonic acid-amido synthetase JAR1 n=1 Tax=Glycine soja TaxID=3848 RepID=A0A445GXQ9_GLYSO|nr:Jasmonic acid-amido synthetase JAR1 [Glycine soja]
MLEKVEEFNMDKVIQEFELLTRDAERVQRETLKRILEDNASAEYLQSLGLNGRTDPESFKACVPMVTHKELEPYIYRIIDGDSSPTLTGKPITTMSLRCILQLCYKQLIGSIPTQLGDLKKLSVLAL